MISVKNASKIYPRHLNQDKPDRELAIDNIDLEIDNMGVHAIIGRNGSGKSTLIRSIMGLIKLTSGNVLINNMSPRNPNSRIGVGYLPELFFLEDNMSVFNILKWQCKFFGMSNQESLTAVDEWSSKLNMNNLLNKNIKNMSKGQRQRVGFCLALVHNPSLIILDEPMSGLDPVGRWEFSNVILSLKEHNKTILLCSHIFDDVQKFSDNIHILDDGKKICSISVDDLGSESLESFFLKKIGITTV